MRTSEWQVFSGIQYGFQWETHHYMERKINYGGNFVVYYQFKTDGSGNKIHVVPDGCIDLLFCCDVEQPEATVCGTVLEGKELLFYPSTYYFGVRLSAKLSLLLPGVSLRDVIDLQAPFQDALTPYVDMGARIALQSGFMERIACFERYCLPLVTGASGQTGIVDYCLQEMHRTSGNVTIRDLAQGTGYSERYVRTKFEQSLGMSPKLYNRIVRFQQTLGSIMRGKTNDINVAVEQGYYDQSHLTKDFKTFSHLTPSELRLKWRTPEPS
jgi:AraC-like DNA-binding protein